MARSDGPATSNTSDSKLHTFGGGPPSLLPLSPTSLSLFPSVLLNTTSTPWTIRRYFAGRYACLCCQALDGRHVSQDSNNIHAGAQLGPQQLLGSPGGSRPGHQRPQGACMCCEAPKWANLNSQACRGLHEAQVGLAPKPRACPSSRSIACCPAALLPLAAASGSSTASCRVGGTLLRGV